MSLNLQLSSVLFVESPIFVDPSTPDELADMTMEPEVDSHLVSHVVGK